MFEIPPYDFNKIINIKMKGNKVVLKLECSLKCEIYQYYNSYYYLKNIRLFDRKFMHQDQTINRIILSEQEISQLIKDNKYKEIFKTNIRLDTQSASNNLLKNAINQLELASKGFEEGNYHKILVSSRNAIFNHLTEIDSSNSKQPKRIIKKEIKELYLSNAPEDLVNFYEDVLYNVERMLVSISGLLSKFIHTDIDKIKQISRIEDLELIYFSTCLLTKYLTNLTNS